MEESGHILVGPNVGRNAVARNVLDELAKAQTQRRLRCSEGVVVPVQVVQVVLLEAIDVDTEAELLQDAVRLLRSERSHVVPPRPAKVHHGDMPQLDRAGSDGAEEFRRVHDDLTRVECGACRGAYLVSRSGTGSHSHRGLDALQRRSRDERV